MVRYFILLLFLGTAQAQSIYCSLDNNTSAKVTLSNFVLYSEQLDNAAWTKNSGVTVVANAITAPDGTLTADSILSTTATTTSGKSVYPTASAATITVGLSYRISAYLKQGTHRYVQLIYQGTSNIGVTVDLANGSIGYASPTITSYSSTSVGNGWYRVSMTFLATNTALYPTLTYALTATSTISPSIAYAGTEAFYAWGISSQLASSPSDYLITTSASATLGPLCGSYQTASPLDPTLCLSLTNRGREIRTEAQIAIGSQ
jgi:hypothetical protein